MQQLVEIKNLSTFVVYSDTQRSTWVSERGTFNSVKNRTLYTDPVLFFFSIAALHVYMLVVLGHLINKSKFSFHLLYTHTPNTKEYYMYRIIIHWKLVRKTLQLWIVNIIFKRTKYNKSVITYQNHFNTSFLKKTLIRITKSYCQSTSSLSN